MWFNAVTLYPFKDSFEFTAETLENALNTQILKSCPPHARETIGFTPISFSETILSRAVNDCYAISAAKEIRLLPNSVVQAILEEKIRVIELETSRPVRRAERLKMKEDIAFDLLPKAFTLQKKDWLYIDTVKNWVVLHTSNPNKASEIMTLLTRALGSIGASPLSDNPTVHTTLQTWLRDPSTLPTMFTLRQHATLINLQGDKSIYHCKDIEKNAHEIQTLLDEGYEVTSIDLTWLDRLQFTFTQPFAIKRIKCLDYLEDMRQEYHDLENEQAQFDSNFALLTHEIRELMTSLLTILNYVDA